MRKTFTSGVRYTTLGFIAEAIIDSLGVVILTADFPVACHGTRLDRGCCRQDLKVAAAARLERLLAPKLANHKWRLYRASLYGRSFPHCEL